MPESSASLHEFIEAAGNGLSTAQKAIAGTELSTTTVAVAEASLEAKVSIEGATDGTVRVRPVGQRMLSDKGVNLGAVSTLNLTFVALADDTADTASRPPSLDRNEAISQLAERDDVKKLGRILGGLDFQASAIPDRGAWLVTAFDPKGRSVRQVVIGGPSD